VNIGFSRFVYEPAMNIKVSNRSSECLGEEEKVKSGILKKRKEKCFKSMRG
jgi:hypothetical protein